MYIEHVSIGDRHTMESGGRESERGGGRVWEAAEIYVRCITVWAHICVTVCCTASNRNCRTHFFLFTFHSMPPKHGYFYFPFYLIHSFRICGKCYIGFATTIPITHHMRMWCGRWRCNHRNVLFIANAYHGYVCVGFYFRYHWNKKENK